MACESVALLAFHQNFHFQNSRYVGRESLDERRDGEFFGEDAGTVTVGEGGIDVDDGEAGVDEVDTANLGPRGQGMRGRFVEIEGDESTENFFGALLADRRHGDLSRLSVEDADVVVGHVQSNGLGGTGDWRNYGTDVGGGDGSGGGASAHVPGVEAHAEDGGEEDGERDEEVAGNHGDIGKSGDRVIWRLKHLTP